jgi:hypothetical protein
MKITTKPQSAHSCFIYTVLQEDVPSSIGKRNSHQIGIDATADPENRALHSRTSGSHLATMRRPEGWDAATKKKGRSPGKACGLFLPTALTVVS